MAGVDFLCVGDKVAILDRIISVAEEPLWPAERLSRGRRKWRLSHPYNGLGLSDSLGEYEVAAQRQRDTCIDVNAILQSNAADTAAGVARRHSGPCSPVLPQAGRAGVWSGGEPAPPTATYEATGPDRPAFRPTGKRRLKDYA